MKDKIIEKEICPLCKTNSLYKVKNQRADASFEYFVHCDKCHEWIGTIRYNGKFKYLSSLASLEAGSDYEAQFKQSQAQRIEELEDYIDHFRYKRDNDEPAKEQNETN